MHKRALPLDSASQDFPSETAAVFEFGWCRKWAVRPDDVDFLTDWPGLGPDCVALLLERGVKAVAVDTLSPDVYGDGENQFSARNSFSRMNAMRLFPSTHA